MYKCNKVYNKNINNSQSQKQVSLTQSLTGKSHYLVRRMHFTKLFSTLALVHLAISTALPVMENRDMSTEFEKRVSPVPLLLMLSTHLNAKEYFLQISGRPLPLLCRNLLLCRQPYRLGSLYGWLFGGRRDGGWGRGFAGYHYQGAGGCKGGF